MEVWHIAEDGLWYHLGQDYVIEDTNIQPSKKGKAPFSRLLVVQKLRGLKG